MPAVSDFCDFLWHPVLRIIEVAGYWGDAPNRDPGPAGEVPVLGGGDVGRFLSRTSTMTAHGAGTNPEHGLCILSIRSCVLTDETKEET